MKVEQFDQQYSKFYNLLYADKHYDKEVEYVDRLLKQYSPRANSILEYGSGTGGHGLLLNKLGYAVYGLERSAEMAQVAKSRGLECEIADIVNFDLNRSFDACISLFHVISYVNNNDQLIRVFQNTKKHLKKNGLFIFDVWFTPAVLHQVPETRMKKIENDEIQATRIATPTIDHTANVVGVNYSIIIKDKASGQYSEFTETHNMRHFGIPEIDLIAKQTGFRIIKAEEFLTGEMPTNKTWGVNFILQSTNE